MKEIVRIINKYELLKSTTTKLALATVIEVSGSSYRRTGARMLIQDNGEYTGGISGGCIEGNALKKAQLAMFSGKATQVTYDTSKDDEAQIGVSLGCNGIITVLIAPIDTTNSQNPVEQLKSCRDMREPTLLITVLHASKEIKLSAGQVMRYEGEDGLKLRTDLDLTPAIKNDFIEAIDSGESVIREYDSYKLFLEIIPPAIQLVIMGGNYDVYPLLQVAQNLGWETIIVTNPRRLHKSIHRQSDAVVENFDQVVIDKYSAAILMSHDYNIDLINLKNTLASDLVYIGLLGPASRKKEMLLELNITKSNDENRIFGPAGLDIGAAQPEEIAISITAEILMVLNSRSGSSLKTRQGPIYDR